MALRLVLPFAAGGVLLGLYLARLSFRPGAPPDLRLDWVGEEGAVTRGEPGETLELAYSVTNTGGRDAFAVYLTATTPLGSPREPVRLEPGPAAGRSLYGTLVLPLTAGMGELCLEARLQNLAADAPRESSLDDNTVCRRIEIHTSPAAGGETGPLATTGQP